MAAFQVFVHRTLGIVKDIRSAPMNLPEGGFYSLPMARRFALSIADLEGVISAYDPDGRLLEVLKAPKDLR